MSTAAFVDTHCHLQDAAFEADVTHVVSRAEAAGVLAMVDCGYDAPSNEGVLALAGRCPSVRPAVGFHPHEAKDVTPAMLAELEAQARSPGIVAIGEIGLDYYRDHSPHDVQRSVFERQLEIAVRRGLPVSVHSRGAEEAIGELLTLYAAASPLGSRGRPMGVLHCFGGTLEQARHYVTLGFLVSVACVITYPKSEEARKLAASLPLESLVAETDSPYLPPQTMRGKRNEPAMVATAVAAIANARGISLAAAARATTANAARLFALPAVAQPTGAVSR